MVGRVAGKMLVVKNLAFWRRGGLWCGREVSVSLGRPGRNSRRRGCGDECQQGIEQVFGLSIFALGQKRSERFEGEINEISVMSVTNPIRGERLDFAELVLNRVEPHKVLSLPLPLGQVGTGIGLFLAGGEVAVFTEVESIVDCYGDDEGRVVGIRSESVFGLGV